MSIKTLRKRIALVAVSALGVGLLTSVPVNAAASTKVQSSVTGTIAAVANGAAATGTFSITLNEQGATTWTSTSDQEIVLGLVTRYGSADECWVDGNDDTTPAGTVTVTGESDTMFATATSIPYVEVDETAKTFTVVIPANSTGNGQVESITISGLVVKCAAGAVAGSIYVVVESNASAELDPAYVNASFTTAEALPNFVADNDRINISNSSTSAFPIKAITGESIVIDGKYIPVDGGSSLTGVTYAHATDLFTKTSHGLTGTDKVYLESAPAGFSANTAYYVIAVDANTFKLATSVSNSIAGTAVDETADGSTAANDSDVTVNMSWVDVNAGTLSNLSCTAAGPSVCTSAAHGLSTGDALVFTAMDSLAATTAPNNVKVGGIVYVIRVSANTFNIAVTYADALAGNGITASTASNGALTAVKKGISFPSGARPSGTSFTLYGPDTLLGSADSDTYLGRIGSVSASFNSYVDATKIVTSVADNITTSNSDGDIEVRTNSSGAIADDSSTTITVTLTGGQFAVAPTVSAVAGTCTLDATLTYPRNSITILSPLGTCTGVSVRGDIDAKSLKVGESVTFVATVANSTNPVSYTTVLQTNKIISYGAATANATSQVSLAATAEDVAATTVTVKESAAATFKAGYYLNLCFTDATGDDLFSSDVKNVWATVTSGDLKLEGNKTSVLASLTATNVSANDVYDGTAKQCATVRIFSVSTVASTVTWSAGTALVAESTTGFNVDTGDNAGAITMGVLVGDTATTGLLYNTFVLGSRNAAANYVVSAATSPNVIPGAAAQTYGDVIIQEAKYGKFVAGQDIVVDLTDAGGTASAVAAFASTAGANAPVVTQTNTASEIRWSYVVTDFNTITISVVGASTANAATFKISNIKINLSDVKSSGVAVNSADTYVTVSGAGIASGKYPVQAAKVATAATGVTNAEVLAAIVKLIASINKQIAKLQKLIRKK